MNATVRGRLLYFALANTNNTQIKLKEEQKEDIRQIVNARGFGGQVVSALAFHL
jgi:hypothetical protein